MFITADQLLCHLIGDYLLQSDWMAQKKTSSWWPAACHGIAYTVPFLAWMVLFWPPHPPSWASLAAIAATHALIDRYRLARYVVWLKERLSPRRWWVRWVYCRKTGYDEPGRPEYLTTWLAIIADNTLHAVVNGIVLWAAFNYG